MLLAIFGFCCVSSMTYIINDWVDRVEDRHHPTKKDRPLASGRISGKQAELVGVLLLIILIVIVSVLGWFYLWPVLIYFMATNAYSFGLKRIPFLDIMMIAGNFIMRMLGGMTNWPGLHEWGPFIFVFMLMLMFLSHKRRSDIKLLGKRKAYAHKAVLKYYRRPVVYVLRGFSYLGIAWGMYLMELHWSSIVALMLVILMTSYEFVQEAKLVMKPHHLLMRPRWSLSVFVAVAILLFL